MLETIAKFAVIAVFLIVTIFIGAILWQSLFRSEKYVPSDNGAHEYRSVEQSANKRPDVTATGPKESVDDRLATYTLWLAVFTALLVLVSAFQIGFLINADKTASIAADAAQKSADIANDSLKTLQRAFVFLATTNYASHFDPTTGKIWWSLEPIWENSGNTPTRDLRINVNSRVTKDAITEHFDFPPAGASIPLMIRPHGTISGDAISIGGDELVRVQKGELHFYVWGWAKYRDVFEGTKEHVTRFSYEVHFLGDPTKAISQNNVVELHTPYLQWFTCHDEECS